MLRFEKLLCYETQVSNKHMGKIKSPLDLIMKNSYIENGVEGYES